MADGTAPAALSNTAGKTAVTDSTQLGGVDRQMWLSPADVPTRLLQVVSRISHTSFDAIDSYSQSLFWSKVLGYVEDRDDPNLPEHEECLIMAPDHTQMLLFIRVPDEKQLKNRVHLDLRPVDRTREEEVQRLLALGATHYEDHRRPDGSGWITLKDPEGNEFCVLQQFPSGSGPTA